MRAAALRPLAASAPQRLAGEFAQAPTWRELGVEAVFSNVRAVLGPNGLGPEPIRHWENVFSRIAASEEWQRELALHHRSDAFLGHEAARAAWRRLREDISRLLSELGLARG